MMFEASPSRLLRSQQPTKFSFILVNVERWDSPMLITYAPRETIERFRSDRGLQVARVASVRGNRECLVDRHWWARVAG